MRNCVALPLFFCGVRTILPELSLTESKRPKLFSSLRLINLPSRSLSLSTANPWCYIGVHLTFPEVQLIECPVSQSVVSSSVCAPYDALVPLRNRAEYPFLRSIR
jgi:hypothetical protein